MNKVFLIGRLTRDPELRYTGSNTAVASFSLAVNRNFINDEGEREADFINIVVWKKQAENVKKYLSKGSKVAIEGRLQISTYQNQKGENRYITEVVAENIEFLDNKSKSNIEVSYKKSDEPFKEFAKEHQEELDFEDEEGYELPFE